MFAVIETGGKQYRVTSGDVLRVERLAAEKGGPVVFERVLAVGGAGESGEETPGDPPAAGFRAGQPVVEGARVEAEVLDHGRGRKIIIFRKKRRKNHRRRNGHRQHETLVRIGRISVPD